MEEGPRREMLLGVDESFFFLRQAFGDDAGGCVRQGRVDGLSCIGSSKN